MCEPRAARRHSAADALADAKAILTRRALRRVRKPAPIIEAACWSHATRNFYELATLQKAPIAMKAVLFGITPLEMVSS